MMESKLSLRLTSKKNWLVGFSVFVFLMSAACKNKEMPKASKPEPKSTLQHVIVKLQPKNESQVSGQVEFINEPDGGVRVKAQVRGLKPNTKHGFHIHEKPDCSAKDAATAGEHFNPMGHEHGQPNTGYHAGDLGNLEANAQGEVTLDQVFTHISLLPADPTYIINRSVVIHAEEDDLLSQPAGNAGDRMACGAITLQ